MATQIQLQLLPEVKALKEAEFALQDAQKAIEEKDLEKVNATAKKIAILTQHAKSSFQSRDSKAVTRELLHALRSFNKINKLFTEITKIQELLTKTSLD